MPQQKANVIIHNGHLLYLNATEGLVLVSQNKNIITATVKEVVAWLEKVKKTDAQIKPTNAPAPVVKAFPALEAIDPKDYRKLITIHPRWRRAADKRFRRGWWKNDMVRVNIAWLIAYKLGYETTLDDNQIQHILNAFNKDALNQGLQPIQHIDKVGGRGNKMLYSSEDAWRLVNYAVEQISKRAA